MLKLDVNYSAETKSCLHLHLQFFATNHPKRDRAEELWLLNFVTVKNPAIKFSNILKKSEEIEEKHNLNDRISSGPLWSGN